MSELSAVAQTGPVFDRINMDLRRRQLSSGQAKPQGLPVAPKAAPKPADRWASVASRLWAKAIPAQVEVSPGVFSYATPGAGIVGYGDIPTSISKKIGTDKPILGWNPKDLDKEETFLLNQLVAMRQKEAQAAEKTYATDPQMMARMQEVDDE